jgi:hypothetical protein
LNDFGIPLYLNHTITKIEGKERVTGIVASEVDENKQPILGTEMHIPCDTVLFSVGLIPENELTKSAGIPLSPRTKGAVVYQNRETETRGIFACGNVLQVHDLVDFVSEESEIAGAAAAEYALSGEKPRVCIDCVNGKNIGYVLPQKIDKNAKGNVKLFFRVTNTFKNCTIRAESGGKVLVERKKRIAVPGEMETLLLTESQIMAATEPITVSLIQSDLK